MPSTRLCFVSQVYSEQEAITALTQCSDGREEQHHLDIAGTRITSHSNQRTGYGSKGIAADVQFVHTVHLGNEGRGKDQCNN